MSEPTRILQEDQEQHGQSQLGRGNVGKVLKVGAHAIKKISKTLVSRYGRLNQLQREVMTLRQINHPNIVKLIEFKENSQQYWIVMELCSGMNLKSFLLSQKYRTDILVNDPRKFGVKVCLDIIHAICELRSHFIVHRDLKSENIMIDISKTGKITTKMIDFGQAKFMINEAMSRVGTHIYMAPEIYFSGSYSQSSDQWSLGHIFYQVLEAIKQGKIYQKNLPNVFTGNFVPLHDRDIEKIYTEFIQHGIMLSKKRTPLPFRKIIKGLLQLNPKHRITMLKMVQILKQCFIDKDEFKKQLEPFLNPEEIQYQKLRIIQSQFKQKQTMKRKSIIQNKIKQLNILYSKLHKPINQAINKIKCNNKYVLQLMQHIKIKIDICISEIYDQICQQDSQQNRDVSKYIFWELTESILTESDLDMINSVFRGNKNTLDIINYSINPKFENIHQKCIDFLLISFQEKVPEIIDYINKYIIR